MNFSAKNILKQVRNKIELFLFDNHFRYNKKNNAVIVGKNCRFRHCVIKCEGTNNTIIFGDNCNMKGLHILMIGTDNRIEFGNNVTVNASPTQPTVINAVGGRSIIIGNGSLFSNNIEIHTSDYHGIYNRNGGRVNPDKDVFIGESVWVGLGSTILKGSHISDGSVVGAGSLLSGVFLEKNVIIAGNPAKIIKHDIFWREERKDNWTSHE